VTIAPADRLLVVDAGNTRVKLGTFDAAALSQRALPVYLHAVAVPTGSAMPWSEFPSPIARALMTGSNPREVERIAREWPQEWPPPELLADRSRLPIVIDVDFPEKVGIDRLLHAIAANVVRAPEQPAVIISSGTATTVDYVDARGRFCGGAILPGFDLCAKALHEYTALLPLIEMSAVLSDDAAPAELGRNTEAAMTSGLYWGHVGAVKELMRRLMHVGEAHHHPLLLLTGGAAPLLHPHLPTIVRYEPHLPLQGLALVAATSNEAAR
jgi:type III pantothenate kinase